MNNLINFRKQHKTQITKLVDEDGNVLENKNDIACKLANEFMVRDSECDILLCSEKIQNYEKEFLCNNSDYKESVISKEEVENAIMHVQKGGANEKTIPKKLIKKFCYTLSKPITILFNIIYTLSCIPITMKHAICTPLYKGKGSYFDSSSYRAIYGLSFITKIFERIIFLRLQFMVDEKMSEFQHGFRSNRSCESATAFVTQSMHNIIDKRNGKGIAVFVDFRKAFDSINHSILLDKLTTKFDGKIEPKMLKLLFNYFQNRSFQIKNNDELLETFHIKSGTPAGSCLGPIIFSLFINDIGEVLTLPYALYADDLVFFVDATNLGEGIKKINECYLNLVNWCNENKLTINTAKTKVMYFYKANDHKSKNLLGNVIRLNNEDIEVVQTFKYLGVNLDSNLSFMYHYDQVKLKTSIALGRMYSLRRYFSLNVVKVFISCYINSISDYCISIWCVQTELMIDGIQSKINNFIFTYFHPVLSLRDKRSKNRKAQTSMPTLLLKLNIFTIQERRILSLLRFLGKELKICLFKDWFIRSPGADNDYNVVRLILPQFVSAKFKNSVKYSAILNWNKFVQLIKPRPKTSSKMFIETVKVFLISKRDLT